MLYFAYGSNMDPYQIRQRCPSSRFMGTAILRDHRLAFTLRSKRRRCGVANVLPAAGQEVHGILYRINRRRDWDVLDAAEGYKSLRRRGNRYRKELLPIHTPGYPEVVLSWIYLGTIENAPPPPSPAYLGQMREGAEYWGLPKAYQKFLAELLKA